MGDAADLVRKRIGGSVYRRRVPLDVAAHHLHGEPIRPLRGITRRFYPFSIGDTWGGTWDTSWFRLTAVVPAEWAGEQIAARVHLGGDQEDIVGFSAEGLVYDRGGRVIQGLHHRHRVVPLSDSAVGKEKIELYVEAAANPRTDWAGKEGPLLLPDYEGPAQYCFDQADLVTVDPEVLGFLRDALVVAQFADVVPDRSEEARRAIKAALSIFDPDRPGSAGPAGWFLRDFLSVPSDRSHRVTAIGHAHIDSAWLWPVRETRRKCARTFANQLRLMERYPEHRFACSQAVQYEWIQEDHPDLFDQIKKRVSEGRWLPVGGMWVEPDCNIPSGESLVRQFVYGKRFFLDAFEVETNEMWIPDVFGYSAALPQIANQAGVTALITQKMSWNDTNLFPHSTFWWEGHDGSRLLAHFPPANTYNGDFSVGELVRSQQNFRDHLTSSYSLYPYGFGDGGGGPTEEMLERARRLADAGGLPAVTIAGVADFLDAVWEENADLATWVGELYLEYHRGTYTTHADVKRANRRAEEALRAAEMWSVAAGIDRRDQLARAWKLLLLSQFHDILPGSSIHWVYEDTARDHAEVLGSAEAVIEEAARQLLKRDARRVVVINSSSYDRAEVVDLPDGSLAHVQVAGCSWSSLDGPGPAGGPVQNGDNWMDNDVIRVTWDDRGIITSIWDHEAGREVVARGSRANLFQIHDDHPASFDAWNVDREYLDHADDLEQLDSMEHLDAHPLRAGIRTVRTFGSSRIEQVMRLDAGSRRLEFHTEVDWHERHRFLKVAFPVDIRSQRATFEIQHGHVERPTVQNTSWDQARFEVAAQRWADLSEPGYGVALINDSKYGYDVRDNVIRLSLLRAPTYPDPEADQGHHSFGYALYPHSGDLRAARVIEQAESFNLPLRFHHGRGSVRLVEVDRPGISIEAVKWADRREGVVIRLCEVHGSRGPLSLTVGADFDSVTRTDLLERDVASMAHRGRTVELSVHPFELVTLCFSGWRRAVG